MHGTVTRKAPWIQHLVFFMRRKPQNTKSDVASGFPPKGISVSAIVSAENALRVIPVGGARPGIGAFLNVIKQLHLTAALNKETLRGLERNIRLLAELLEPLVYIEQHLFPADLGHQLRRLSRELRTISQAMTQSVSPATARRGSSSQNENTDGDVAVFAKDFSLTLDRFRLIALPMYTVCTMEAAIRPLGIVSNSSCGLLPFIDWIQSERDINYRFGLIQSIRFCYRKYRFNIWRRGERPFNSTLLCAFLHIGLLNGRGIENWLEIEVTGTVTRGTVTFGATLEALIHGATKNAPVLMTERALSLTDLAMRLQGIQVTQTDPGIYHGLWPYGHLVVDHPTDQLYTEYRRHDILPAGGITDGTIRNEVQKV